MIEPRSDIDRRHRCTSCRELGHTRTTCPKIIGELGPLPRWKRYQIRRYEEGLCIKCGFNPRGEGRFCRDCQLKKQNSPAEKRASARWARKDRKRRRQLGLCLDHGCEQNAEPDRTRCRPHLDEAAARERERTRKKRAQA